MTLRFKVQNKNKKTNNTLPDAAKRGRKENMDDNKNNYNRENNFNRDNEPGPQREWDSNDSSNFNNNGNNNSNSNSSTEAGSSYYYSYGPFKSLNNDEMNGEDPQHYNRREPERVEISPPQPVKSLPYSTSLRTTGYDGNGGNGGRGGNPLREVTAGSITVSRRSRSRRYLSLFLPE